MDNTKQCSLQGHETMLISHFCIFDQCLQGGRRCCAECILNKIHDHKDQQISYIVKYVDLQKQLDANLQKIKQGHHQYVQNYKIALEQKIQSISDIMQKIIDQLVQYIKIKSQNLQENQKKLQKYIEDLKGDKFQLLDDQSIIQYLKTDANNFILNVQKEIQPLDLIEQKVVGLQNLIEKTLNNQLEQQQNILDLKQTKYLIRDVDITETYFYASQISNNLSYLSYGGEDKILKVYDIKQQSVFKNLYLQKQIYVCQFTDDSTQLFVGLNEGYVYGYKMDDSFELIFQQQIHQHNVLNIIIIQNQYLITCSRDCLIIKTDIKNQKKLFSLAGHQAKVSAIDYNEIDDVVISGSEDKSLKLWSCTNQNMLIDKKQSHSQEIQQLQFINNKQSILSLDRGGNLFHWMIDINNTDLIKTSSFQDQNNIYNFYSINQGLNIFILCDKYVKIVNQKYELLNIINHDQIGKQTYNEQKQLNQSKIFQIRTGQRMMLALMQD